MKRKRFETIGKGMIAATLIALMLLAGTASAAKLVAKYDFNQGSGNVLTDVSGNGHDGIIHGATWVDNGIHGKALQFDGNDYIEIPDSPGLSGGTGKSLTVIYSFNSNKADGWMITKMKDESNKDWGTGIGSWVNGPQALRFYYEKNGPNNDMRFYGGNPQLGIWNRAGFTFEAANPVGTNTAKFKEYLNGAKLSLTPWNDHPPYVFSPDQLYDMPDTTAPVAIGYAGSYYGGGFVDSLIDEVYIYDGVLTDEEMKADNDEWTGTMPTSGKISGYVTSASSGLAISGATVTINSMTTTTDSGGKYSIDIAVGTYTVTANAYGYQTGTANNVVVASSGVTAQDFALVPMVIIPTYDISGTVFNDLNKSGVNDFGEPGLSGWKIELFSTDSGFVPAQIATTGTSGNYLFTSLKPDNYIVSITSQAGWTQTAPVLTGGAYNIVLDGADQTDLDFGEYFSAPLEPGIITGISVLPKDPKSENPMYKEKYRIALKIRNPNPIAQNYKLGPSQDYGTGPTNNVITKCLPDYGPYIVPAGEEVSHDFICTTRWDWIPPGKEGFNTVGEKIAAEAGKLIIEEIAEQITSGVYTAAWDLFESLLESLKLSKQIEDTKSYKIILHDKSTPGITFAPGVNQNVVVEVPFWYKKLFLIESSILAFEASGVDAIGALIDLNSKKKNFFNPVSLAFFGTAAADKMYAFYNYKLAYDPDFNYTTVQEPIPMYLPELDSVPEGDAKQFALATADITSLRNATLTAYVRYDGATIDDQPDYMLMQLEAANNYTLQSVQKMPEVVKYYKLATASMEPMTNEQIQQFREDIQTNGLPQVEIDILTRNGLGDSIENITQMVLNTDPEIYRNPKNYTNLLDLQATMLASESAAYMSEIIRIKVEDKGYSVTTASDSDITYLEDLKSQIQLSIDQRIATPDVKARMNEMIGKSSKVLEETNNLTYQPYYEFAVNALATFQTLDNTPPEINITAPINGAYILNQPVIANWQVTDNDSGIASATATTPNGIFIDTSSVGSKNFTVNATDNAGNTASVTVSYNVAYNLSFSPSNKKTAKSGSAAPIKFNITDWNGKIVDKAIASVYVVSGGSEINATSKGKANIGNLAKFNATEQQYGYILDTSPLPLGLTTIRIRLNDGTMWETQIEIK